MLDMRPYAERLAKAMPERFKLKSNLLRDADNMPLGTHWTEFSTFENELMMDKADVPRWWAFWGPLADELKVRPHGADKDGVPGTLSYEESRSWLEAIAEAVCQEAETLSLRSNRTKTKVSGTNYQRPTALVTPKMRDADSLLPEWEPIKDMRCDKYADGGKRFIVLDPDRECWPSSYRDNWDAIEFMDEEQYLAIWEGGWHGEPLPIEEYLRGHR